MSKLINVVKETFSVIPNEIFTDKRLDYKSKGLLCTLLSLPNGWNFSVAGLVGLVTSLKQNGEVDEKFKGDGKKAVTASLKRLELLGYLERIQTKSPNGKFTGYDYKINIPPLTHNI